MKQKIVIFSLLYILVFNVSASELLVVATNSWTAAYVQEAGYEEVEVLAPVNMLHPSEYELTVDDLMLLKKADLIVFAGYEVMANQLKKSRYIDQSKLLSIETGYDFNVMKSSILKVAEKMKTVDKANENLKNLKFCYDSYKELFEEKGWIKTPVLVHFFQQQLANELNLNVKGVFGPAPPEAYEIKELMDNNFKLIIDNIHNPVGGAIEKSAKCRRIELLNFPGLKNTNGLMDVISYNINVLSDYFE